MEMLNIPDNAFEVYVDNKRDVDAHNKEKWPTKGTTSVNDKEDTNGENDICYF